jgi:hypothetical protein
MFILLYISTVYLRSVPVNQGYRTRSGMRITVSETLLQSQKHYTLNKGLNNSFWSIHKENISFELLQVYTLDYIRTAIMVRSVEVSA